MSGSLPPPEAAARPEKLAVDPENRLWHHHPRRRLEAEAIRDSMLAVSGRLDRTLGGPPRKNRRRRCFPCRQPCTGGWSLIFSP